MSKLRIAPPAEFSSGDTLLDNSPRTRAGRAVAVMATVKPIKREKPADRVAFEPVMAAISKARAMAWVLEQLHANNNLEHALQDAPEETADWLHTVVAEALHEAHDAIEREYRKLEIPEGRA